MAHPKECHIKSFLLHCIHPSRHSWWMLWVNQTKAKTSRFREAEQIDLCPNKEQVLMKNYQKKHWSTTSECRTLVGVDMVCICHVTLQSQSMKNSFGTPPKLRSAIRCLDKYPLFGLLLKHAGFRSASSFQTMQKNIFLLTNTKG